MKKLIKSMKLDLLELYIYKIVIINLQKRILLIFHN